MRKFLRPAKRTVLFVTERTRVELVSTHHVDALHEYYANNRVHLSRWEPRRGEEFFTRAAGARRIRSFVSEYRRGKSLRMVAYLESNGPIVAQCSFTNITPWPMLACNLGYSVDEKLQGTGVMREILTGALDHVFEDLKMHRVVANYMPENERSGRLLRHLGFEVEGYARAYLHIDGAWRDHVLTAKRNPYELPVES